MPNKLFGVDIRLPEKPRSNRSTPRGTPRGTPSATPRTSPQGSPKSSASELVRRSSIPGMENFKRPSLPGLGKKHGSHDKKDRSLSKDKHAHQEVRSPLQQQMVRLGMYMESPPIILMGPPSSCTGALISGRLQLTPNVTEAIVETISMYLECTTTVKRPVSDRCRQCQTVVDDLFEWKFLSKPKVIAAQDGTQELPFSHLIPGHIPATTHGELGSIDYQLHVKAKMSDGQDVEFRRSVWIRRALFPGNEKHSVRIFPPTTLNLHVTLPSLVHPIGEFPIQCRMTGILNKRDDAQTRWRLRKLTWRIEETEKMISPACSKHLSKLGASDGERKGILNESTRDIAVHEIKEGWKTDMDEGEIEGEFMASIDGSTHPQCGMKAQNGSLEITHNLVLELVIAEEWASNKKPQNATPTGAARVLRTQFALNVTERTGMGLSWDDEMPPMYEDVPASPPRYLNGNDGHTTMEVYEGDDLHEDIEHLNLEDS